VSVFGLVRVKGSPEVSLAQFRSSLSQRGAKDKTSGGPFSIQPTIADVESMRLSDQDLADLRDCSVGECNINLNARAIERFRTEVDWNSPQHRTQAERLMQEVLAGYAANYFAGGDKALGSFDNRRQVRSLAVIHREILEGSRFLREAVPELYAHLANFPESRRPDIEDELGWSTVEFGLKPMVVLTHSAVYSDADGSGVLYAIAAKQFYANHYLDSSLAGTFLLRVMGAEGPETYLLFTDRSRSNTLSGPLGSIARNLVEKEAATRVEKLLDSAHLNILAEEYRRNHPEPEGSEESDRAGGFFANRWVQAALIAAAVIFAVLLFFNRRK
jgi:hypothetical protein